MTYVSVPEKTLEHWTSQYLLHRYRTHASIWWPAFGEDVDVRWLPARPGKALQLEIKTSTVRSGSRQCIEIDLGQLRRYCDRPFARQPFYVFPWPDWVGKLEEDAERAGLAVTELAYRRSGSNWWFADWMVAMTSVDVAKILATPLHCWEQGRGGRKADLVQVEISDQNGWRKRSVTWADGKRGDRPELLRWKSLWHEITSCGRAEWPQMFRIPWAVVRRNSKGRVDGFDRADLDRLLSGSLEPTASSNAHWDSFATIVPDGEGGFWIEDGAESGPEAPSSTGFDSTRPDEYRQVVFIDGAVLHPAM